MLASWGSAISHPIATKPDFLNSGDDPVPVAVERAVDDPRRVRSNMADFQLYRVHRDKDV
jgi:hypothetical protein